MTPAELDAIEARAKAAKRRAEVLGHLPGPWQRDLPALVAEVRRLKLLLRDAHGVVTDQSLCSCDDRPPVLCEAAQAADLSICSHGRVQFCLQCV